MDTVTFEQATRLYDLGYKGQWPQMAWIDYDYHPPSRTHPPGWHVEYRISIPLSTTGYWVEWYPAPSYLEALEWLEKAKGWVWQRYAPGANGDIQKYVARQSGYSPVVVDDPSALLDAILEKKAADVKP